MPQKAAKVNYFTKLAQTEEGRALRKLWSRKPRKNPGRPMGVPDGMTKVEADAIRAEVQAEARKVVAIMTEHNPELKDDELAQEALQTAVELMRFPGGAQHRIAAAKLVLEYTKQKPAAKNELTINKAEEFLASLLNHEAGTD